MPIGALIDLAAYGPQDVYLTGNPQISFFVAVYKRHTNFAIESIEEVLVGNADFGQKVYAVLGRYGDLVSEIYLDVTLPALNTNPKREFSCSWVNSIGHALILMTEVEIGGVMIDRQYGQWLEIWGELTVTEDKRCAYNAMIGKHEYFNATLQQDETRLHIPLQFWFCRNKGLALPLIALQNHQIRINISFRDFNELWISSTGTKSLKCADLSPGCISCPEDIFLEQDAVGVVKITQAILYVDYIYLDDDERKWFALTEHQYLIEQVQQNVHSANTTSIENVIPLDFNHPVKEIIWVIRDQAVLTKVPHGGNEWFNFSDRPITVPGMPMDPMIEATLWYEGRERFCTRDAFYFRAIQPYQRHTVAPDNFIYVYSFGFSPEEHQPTGTSNYSRLDNVTLNVKMKETLVDPLITIYGPNYNILRIRDGMAGLLYAD